MLQVRKFDKGLLLGGSAAAAMAVLITTIMIGCGGKGESSSGKAEMATSQPAAALPAGVIEGEVKETMDSGGYTYVRLESKGVSVWAAGPVTKLAVGDKVRISTGMEMPDFHSETLDRTFDSLYFVSTFAASGPSGMGGTDMTDAVKKMHDSQGLSSPASERTSLPKEAVGEIEKAAGGLSVAEIYTGQAGLVGKSVIVRGKVVKFTPAIMGRNWVHLQDGTCDGESCDLTVTTDETVGVGDVVTFKGVLAADKDFGAGYRYEVIIESASLVKNS